MPRHSQNTATAHRVADSKLGEFFISQLRDIYWAEQHTAKTLPKMNDVATSPKLKQRLTDHLEQTKHHVSRLEEVFQLIDEAPKGEKCKAIIGIIDEGMDIIDKTEKGTATRDVAIIFAAQKIEHYEIATYGCLIQVARTLDHSDVANILVQTLREEKEADNLLTQIAESSVNTSAYSEAK